MTSGSGRSAAATVLISGAGLAGPVLAHWLRRYGFDPVVVESRGSLRSAGYPVDLRGPAVDAIERMGLLPAVRAARMPARDVTFVDRRGRRAARLPAAVLTGSRAGRDIEIPRGELVRLLYERTRDDVPYVFGDSVTGLHQEDGGVRVEFCHAPPRTVDLVVGADGLHSTVRRLVFGPHEQFEHHLGYCFSAFSSDPGTAAAEAGGYVLQNTPGRLAGWYPATGRGAATGVLAFAGPSMAHDHADREQRREVVARAFNGLGWEVPRLLRDMWSADDLYVDSVSQVRMPRWSAGRVALVGDAAFAPALLSGQGTSLAVVGAYVLAGELAAAAGDPVTAFGAYEATMRPFVERNQAVAGSGGSTLIPLTGSGIWLRNHLIRALPLLAPVARLLNGNAARAASSLSLRTYGPDSGWTASGARR